MEEESFVMAKKDGKCLIDNNEQELLIQRSQIVHILKIKNKIKINFIKYLIKIIFIHI